MYVNSESYISSDSDFELAAQQAGYTGYQVQEMQNKIQVKKPFSIQKDVSKTFKKMLTSNHTRSFLTSATQTNRSSTKDGESITGAVDIADQDKEYNEEIENKFAIKTATK